MERFSFRHDMTIETIRDLLARHHVVRVLDCGCGPGGVLTTLARAGLATSRIDYVGVDQDPHLIKLARASVQHSMYQKVELKVRELSDLDGYPKQSFELIVVNNLLHEIPVELLPRLLDQLNSLLARPHGQLLLVDMEALPPEDPFEPWAIMWTASEVMRIMSKGNWSPQATTHPKRVMSYKVVANPIRQVNLHAMVCCLRLALAEKRRCLLDRLSAKREAGEIGEDVAHLACMLASVEVSLRQLSKNRGR